MASVQREPVLNRAAIVTVIAVLSALLVKVGGGNVSRWLDENSDMVAGIILAVAPVVAGLFARRAVTPVSAPKNDDGVPLQPAPSPIPLPVVTPSKPAPIPPVPEGS